MEQELEDFLREHCAVVRGDLSLTVEQQRASDRNAADALARITSTVPPRAKRPPEGRRGRSSSRAIALAAAVLLAVGVVVEWRDAPSAVAHASTPPLLQIDGLEPDSYPLVGTEADPHLERIARLVAAQPPVPGSGAVERIARVGWWLDVDEDESHAAGRVSAQRRVVPVETETLQLPGRVTRVRVRRGQPMEVSGQLDDVRPGPITSDETFPLDSTDPLNSPERLPHRPSALRTALLGRDADCGGMEAYCLFESASMLNLTFLLRPQLEAGLTRAFIQAPDIRYAGAGRDRIGRNVEVFVIDDPDRERQYLLLFDEATGKYVGKETVLIVAQPDLRDVDAPAVVEFAAVTSRTRIPETDVPE
ncbi:hypothetical protein [Nocardioides sp. W7]|uniref:hypothetical protein n=1 Tax=Nocardioides sp. W7 TaxID=2931390 RepID=UPI001FD32461|nr:hypothetical protein [Nocardioides sp. W7]